MEWKPSSRTTSRRLPARSVSFGPPNHTWTALIIAFSSRYAYGFACDSEADNHVSPSMIVLPHSTPSTERPWTFILGDDSSPDGLQRGTSARSPRRVRRRPRPAHEPSDGIVCTKHGQCPSPYVDSGNKPMTSIRRHTAITRFTRETLESLSALLDSVESAPRILGIGGVQSHSSWPRIGLQVCRPLALPRRPTVFLEAPRRLRLVLLRAQPHHPCTIATLASRSGNTLRRRLVAGYATAFTFGALPRTISTSRTSLLERNQQWVTSRHRPSVERQNQPLRRALATATLRR
jgi:hypothetical protein